MSAVRLAYTALVRALLPAALARLYWRGRREPGYRTHVAERFGRYSEPRPDAPVIWVHAVSVGETRAAEPLVRAIAGRYPGHQVLLTHMTPTGRATGEALFGADVMRAYLPYDYPGAVARFLDHYAPAAGILIETEIWPNLLRACAGRDVPVYLVNARLSERSLRGYARFATLARKSFGALRAVAAQTEDDALRLRAIGAARTLVTGNLKFDVPVDAALIELGRAWRAGYGKRRVLLAASTRDGEEALLLDALHLVPADTLLVLVPRHPHRFDEIATLLESRGVLFQRRSEARPVGADARVLLGDSMGEMAAYFAACDIAFIGGSLLPLGGQNLIEACAVGRPVLIGPSTYNFEEAAEKAIEAGAALRVRDATGVMETARRLLGDGAALALMGERGIAFASAHRGATERVMRMLKIRGES